jgi:bacterioferritin-associated ferredoxin
VSGQTGLGITHKPIRHECLDPMIICSCNVLADDEIREAAMIFGTRPLNARLIYDCLGCSMQCGRCARTTQRILDEASRAAKTGHS